MTATGLVLLGFIAIIILIGGAEAIKELVDYINKKKSQKNKDRQN